MKNALASLRRFAREDDGAAMVEYTILLGIITAAVIVTIIAVGTWIGGQWTGLNTQLQAVPAAGAGGADGGASN